MRSRPGKTNARPQRSCPRPGSPAPTVARLAGDAAGRSCAALSGAARPHSPPLARSPAPRYGEDRGAAPDRGGRFPRRGLASGRLREEVSLNEIGRVHVRMPHQGRQSSTIHGNEVASCDPCTRCLETTALRRTHDQSRVRQARPTNTSPATRPDETWDQAPAKTMTAPEREHRARTLREARRGHCPQPRSSPARPRVNPHTSVGLHPVEPSVRTR